MWYIKDVKWHTKTNQQQFCFFSSLSIPNGLSLSVMSLWCQLLGTVVTMLPGIMITFDKTGYAGINIFQHWTTREADSQPLLVKHVLTSPFCCLCIFHRAPCSAHKHRIHTISSSPVQSQMVWRFGTSAHLGSIIIIYSVGLVIGAA